MCRLGEDDLDTCSLACLYVLDESPHGFRAILMVDCVGKMSKK